MGEEQTHTHTQRHRKRRKEQPAVGLQRKKEWKKKDVMEYKRRACCSELVELEDVEGLGKVCRTLKENATLCFTSWFLSLWHLINLFSPLIWSKLQPTNCMQITGHVLPSLPAVDIDIFNQLLVGSSQTRQAGRESTRLKSKFRDHTPEGHVLPCLPRSMSLAMLSTHVKDLLMTK